MCEQEERRLAKVWNDMIDKESQHCPSMFVEARVVRMCELHFAAGRDFEREQASQCRAALEKISTLLGKACVAPAVVEIRRVIEAGLSDGPPSEPPPPTLKDLREAAGLSLEYVGGVTRLRKGIFEQWEAGEGEAGEGWYLSDGTLHALSLLYDVDKSAIQAAIEASRKQRKDADA